MRSYCGRSRTLRTYSNNIGTTFAVVLFFLSYCMKDLKPIVYRDYALVTITTPNGYEQHEVCLTEQRFREFYPDAILRQRDELALLQKGEWLQCDNGWIVMCTGMQHYKQPDYNSTRYRFFLMGYTHHTRSLTAPIIWQPGMKRLADVAGNPKQKFFANLLCEGVGFEAAHDMVWPETPMTTRNGQQRLNKLLHSNKVVKMIVEDIMADKTLHSLLADEGLGVKSVTDYVRDIMRDPDSNHASRKWACEFILEHGKEKEVKSGTPKETDEARLDQQERIRQSQARVHALATGTDPKSTS